MKRLLAVLATLLLVACASSVPVVAHTSRSEVVDMQVDRTVRIDIKCKLLNGWYGSGVILGNDFKGNTLVATAAHVVPLLPVEKFDCKMLIGGLRAVDVAWDEKEDWAVIKFRDGTYWPDLEYQEPKLGLPVRAVGWSWEMLTKKAEMSVSEGLIVTMFDTLPRFRVSASFYSGSSGGGLWDFHGKLVGLTVAGWQMAGLPVDDQYYVVDARNVFKAFYRNR